MTILVCGEALYDLLQTGSGENGEVVFDAQPGGSPFNVAMGIARLGGNAALLTGLSTDAMGERLHQQLVTEGVDTGYLVRSGRRTTLSVVGLDQNGSPDYAFYGVGSADCALTIEDMPNLSPEIQALHFGSYSLVVQPVADALAALALGHPDRFISLDPNIRPTIEPDMQIWRDRIDALRPHADLIKVSVEDLAHLFPGEDPEAIVRSWAQEHPCTVVLTAGAKGISAFNGDDVVNAVPPKVDVVDTVGAGDSVQASLLMQLQHRGAFEAPRSTIPTDTWREMIEVAVTVGARTCTVRGARMPLDAAQSGGAS